MATQPRRSSTSRHVPGGARRGLADLRARLLILLPNVQAVEHLLQIVTKFPEVKEALGEQHRPPKRGRRTPDKFLALVQLVRAIGDLRMALEHARDPATGGLCESIEWAFDQTFGEDPLERRFREFCTNLERLNKVADTLNQQKRGRPRKFARDFLDREIVRAVHDADRLQRPKRGVRSTLLSVAELVYEHCGYVFDGEKTPGIRAALKAFRAADDVLRNGAVEFREATAFDAVHYREK